MSRRTSRFTWHLPVLVLGLAACAEEEAPAPPEPEPVAKPSPAGPDTPAEMDRALVLSLAQFVTVDGKPRPGAARLEFLYRKGGEWQTSAMEDDASNVFHKAMTYERAAGDPVILTLAGTAALVKTWELQGGELAGRVEWEKDFGGKFSRMRDGEIADLFGDGRASVAVATHDQGVVAVLRPKDEGGFEVEEIDAKPDTFVHEIEIGDLDGDGVLEVYATPSEPNRLDGSIQTGEVVRYVPQRDRTRALVADLKDRHAKEILVEDVDGDGRDELYVAVEGHVGPDKELLHPVEIRRYDADTPPDQGAVIASIPDRLTRFLTAGDVDGDGKKELVATAFSTGVWLFRPAADPRGKWKSEQVDRDSRGFEHASILTDLDGDGLDELYVASDHHKEVRRYVWDGARLVRQTIYVRPDNRPIFTWNLMPVPMSLVPGA